MYKYLLIFILSLMLISGCGDEGTKGGEPGKVSSTSGAATGKGQGSGISEHWIFSVPFQKIDAGSFTMGSPTGESESLGGSEQDDEGQVSVEISKSFEIMEKELTQKQWFLVKKENTSTAYFFGDDSSNCES